jgi:hypothetical protein
VTDLSAFRTLADDYVYTVEGGGAAGIDRSESFTSAHGVPQLTWRIGDGFGAEDVTTLTVVYRIAGVEYFFTLRGRG